MKRAGALEFGIQLVARHTNVTTLGMHHAVNYFSIHNQANPYSCANGNVAQTLSAIQTLLIKQILRQNIAVCVKEKLCVSQLVCFFKVLVHVGVGPAWFWCLY